MIPNATTVGQNRRLPGIVERQAKLHLLSNAVKVVPALLPKIAHSADQVAERLNLPDGIDVYVYPDKAHQAMSLRGGEQRPAVLISSGMIELLSPEELLFVIGHEVGHYVFGHHCYAKADSAESEVVKMNLLELSRAAEISADRIGHLCCDTLEIVCSAMLKTATGLGSTHIKVAPGALLDQLRKIVSMGGSDQATSQSHPMFPVRLQSLILFDMSEPSFQWRKKQHKASLTKESLDRRIEKLLLRASGDLVDRLKEKSLAMAEIWAVLRVAIEDNRVTKAEQQALEEIFGEGVCSYALEFLRAQRPGSLYRKVRAVHARYQRTSNRVPLAILRKAGRAPDAIRGFFR